MAAGGAVAVEARAVPGGAGRTHRSAEDEAGAAGGSGRFPRGRTGAAGLRLGRERRQSQGEQRRHQGEAAQPSAGVRARSVHLP